MVSKVFSVILVIAIIAAPLVHAQAGCVISPNLANCNNVVCDLGTLVADLIAELLLVLLCPHPQISLSVTSGNYTLNLGSNYNTLYGLSLSATGSAALAVTIDNGVNFVQDIVVAGLATVWTAEEILVNVAGAVTVAAGSALHVGGNLSVSGSFIVHGWLHLDGPRGNNKVALKASQVTIAGTSSSPAYLTGNGAIVGNVVSGGNTIFSAGNSVGRITVGGSLVMLNTDTIIIEFSSAALFDQWMVEGTFTRAGTIEQIFLGSYVPNSQDRLVFSNHYHAIGQWFNTTVNRNDTYLAYGMVTSSTGYDDPTLGQGAYGWYCTHQTCAQVVEESEA